MNLKKFRLKNLRPVLLIALALVVLISALPGIASAASDHVKFTVTNKSDKVFTLRLNGPELLYLVVEPGAKKTFTPLRGAYTFVMFSCGAYADGDLDLSTIKTMVVPECGSSGPENTTGKKIDASDTIKLVKITIDNNATNSNLLVILTGPGSYVFSLKTGQELSFTVPRGEYSVTYYACSSVGTRSFTAKANKVLTLSCPK